MDFATMFQSLGALAAGVIVIIEFLDSKILPNKMNATITHLVSWGLSIILAITASFLGLGMFAGMIWWVAGLYGIGVGLVANGIFSVPIVQTLLELVKIKVPTEVKEATKIGEGS